MGYYQMVKCTFSVPVKKGSLNEKLYGFKFLNQNNSLRGFPLLKAY